MYMYSVYKKSFSLWGTTPGSVAYSCGMVRWCFLRDNTDLYVWFPAFLNFRKKVGRYLPLLLNDEQLNVFQLPGRSP